jgi:hypothetical protein
MKQIGKKVNLFYFKKIIFFLCIYIKVFLCEFIALVIAGTVHRVCITTCFLFSIGFLFYMNSVSKYFYYSDNNKKK